MEGAIPPDHVPDAVARLNLYARLARLETVGEIDDFEEEIEDRFGAPPDEVSTLFAFARLRCLARAAGVRQVDAGPKAIAVTMASKGTRALVKRLKERWPAAGAKEGRIIVPPAAAPQERRLDLVERLLQDLAAEAR
jgi:transcription-repair coupling factor (superfamily II helicase)